ncbi:VOC family protein [Krasilnikovia sp. MM14-A1259]|uniref:VOC family protein n=1 Tax=Krasilnikovia sp. MM14-A1259 TaxID=3373539 RepID=UPI00382B0205
MAKDKHGSRNAARAAVTADRTPKGKVAKGVAPAPRSAPTPGLYLQPLVHVAEMAASIEFFQHLGAEVIHGGRDTDWVLMQLGNVQIALVARTPIWSRGDGAVELNFAATLPLDDLERLLRERRVTVSGVVHHRDFGPQLQVQSPDGLLVRITQREPDRLI